jgi:hypothetical protein
MAEMTKFLKEQKGGIVVSERKVFCEECRNDVTFTVI